MGDLRRFFKLILPYKKFIVESIATGLLLTLIGLPMPWFTKILIDDVYPNQSISLLQFVLLVVFCFSVFSSLMGIFREYFSLNLGLEMSIQLRLSFFRHIQRLSFDFHDKRKAGEIISRIREGESSIGAVTGLIAGLFTSLTSLMIFPPILFLINWQLSLISMFVLPFDVAIYIFLVGRIREMTKKLAEKEAEISARTYESIAGAKTIQAIHMEDRVFDRLKKLTQETIGVRLKMVVLQQSSGFFLGILTALGSLFYTYYGWSNIISGTITLGSFMAFSSYVGFLYGPIKQLVEMAQGVQGTLVHVRRFFEIYDIEPTIKDKSSVVAISRRDLRGEFELRNVSFSYDGQREILSNVNLRIQPGITAIVGPSGCGKSTLLTLLGRFYDPNMGSVTLDGQDLRNLSLDSLRKNIGFFLQDPFVFYGTLRENITCFCQGDINQDQFLFAVRATCVDEFVNLLPQGYESIIGERGAQFSVGQKQRIALARLFLMDAPIFILDEATNSLDHETEARIFDAIDKMRLKRTIVIVSHHPSAIDYADRVARLCDGRIESSPALLSKLVAVP